jgi:hypothetical protein
MRVGIISDTHGLLRSDAMRQLARSDHIIHAGDIGAPAVIDGLRGIAPTTAIIAEKRLPNSYRQVQVYKSGEFLDKGARVTLLVPCAYDERRHRDCFPLKIIGHN